MQVIIINTIREGYGPDQVRSTMTVAELISALEQYDDDTKVYLGFDNRYTYGGIQERRIEELEVEDE